MKFTTMFLLLALTNINGENETSSCGLLGPNLLPLMTNSDPTKRRWPWHTAIYHRFESDPIYVCGGTLISLNDILTAAHCVQMKSEHVVVSLGRLNLNETERSAQSYDVDKINIHPNFDAGNLDNDIAIVRLSSEVMSNNYVRPICLWKSGQTDLSEIVGKFGTVIGWGKTETGQRSNVLRQASLPVVSWGTCLESNRAFAGNFLTQRNFCAGVLNGTSVCNGDSGGSMMFEENGIYYIRGIVSSTPAILNHTIQKTVCNSMEYAIFTDVAHYLPWIRDKATIIECETIVQCVWSNSNKFLLQQKTCKVNLNVEDSKCKIVFNERSNAATTTLSISGEQDTIPELSDAIYKFSNLETLTLDRNRIKTVERDRLTPFEGITTLDLSFNEITRLDGDTFDDLKNLKELSIAQNKLKEVHADLFKELRRLDRVNISFNRIQSLPAAIFQSNKKIIVIGLTANRLKELHVDLFKDLRYLENLYISENQLEILPPDLFQTNDEMRLIFLEYNKIKKIEPDFYKMPQLTKDFDEIYNKIINYEPDMSLMLYRLRVAINLQGNVCINENFNVTTNAESSSFLEKIQRICSN